MQYKDITLDVLVLGEVRSRHAAIGLNDLDIHNRIGAVLTIFAAMADLAIFLATRLRDVQAY